MRKFKREANLLYDLHNKHIVRVHDLFEENGTVYYVMDFIEGESLSALMKRTGQPLSEQQVLTVLKQLLEALREVHAKRIWHLDIKPGNIIMRPNGEMVLIDFGASKQMGHSDGHTATTTSLAYTPGYAPAEQIDQNTKAIGPWTDLFAVGATLYNLLTRNTPPNFSELDDESAFEFLPTVSQPMRDLIVWMMQPMRRQRPQSVSDVADWLHKNFSQNVVREPQPVMTEPVVPEKEVAHKVEVVQPQQAIVDEKTEVFKKQPDKKQVPPRQQPLRQQPAATTEPRSNKKLIVGILSAVAVAALIGLFAVIVSNIPDKETASPATQTEVAATDKQEKQTVTDTPMTLDFGECSYTGEVDSEGKPDGQGEATYTKGSYYKGQFSHGKMHGTDAYYRFSNGDVFEGEFHQDKFLKGKITLKSDGSYFIGTFANGQPDKGTWYSKDGTITE